jgi:hypothetical protein
LAAVLEAGAGEADVGALLAGGAIGFPAEDGEWASALRVLAEVDLIISGEDRLTILHSAPWSSFNICTYGFSGRQFSQTEGKSVDSQPARLRSCLI